MRTTIHSVNSPNPLHLHSNRLSPFLLFISTILLFHFSLAIPLANWPADETPRRNEMLVPINSTTALICEPVFNQGRPVEEQEARWMHDGREVARVSGRTNAVIGSSDAADEKLPEGQDPIPEIGFLLIRQTQKAHEGEYWCERVEDGVQGERTRLRVAFLDPYPPGIQPRLLTPIQRGQLVVLDCPRPIGIPPPIISWHLNGNRLVDFSSLNVQMAPNGSLLLHNFSAHQSGFYACEAANFVAKTQSESIFLAPPATGFVPRRDGTEPASAFVECLSAYVRNGVLWFLIGCFTTSCVVLAYILGALFLYRLYSLRDRHRWPRSLFAAPGFRKVVAPMAEEGSGRHPPPPYDEVAPASEGREGGGGEGGRTTRTGGRQFDV